MDKQTGQSGLAKRSPTERIALVWYCYRFKDSPFQINLEGIEHLRMPYLNLV
jgi:hypothetical protein